MIYLMNSPILVADGEYKLTSVSLSEAKKVLAKGFTSAIGHQSTADLLSRLLKISVRMNRITLKEENFNVGTKAVILKLDKRPPEGKVLSMGEIEDLGYSFKILERKK